MSRSLVPTRSLSALVDFQAAPFKMIALMKPQAYTYSNRSHTTDHYCMYICLNVSGPVKAYLRTAL